MRLEQEQLRLKQEQDRLKRRLARPHSAHACSQRADFSLSSKPLTQGAQLSSPGQPFALSSPPSSRRALIAGGGFGYSPTAASTTSTDDDLAPPPHHSPSPPGRRDHREGLRPSTASVARAAAAPLRWAHARSPRTPEKKRMRMSSAAGKGEFLNLPGED